MTFLAIILFVIGVAGLCLAHEKNTAQRTTERLKAFRLRRHADEEIELVQRGDLTGWYGQYSPPPALRGVGMGTTHPLALARNPHHNGW